MADHDLALGGEVGKLCAGVGEREAQGLGNLGIESLSMRFEVLQYWFQDASCCRLDSADARQDIPSARIQGKKILC